MKIHDLDNEIVIDSLPCIPDLNQKIFLTTLVHMETPTLPKVFSKIYTSKELKSQFILYLRNRGGEISDENFHIWKPFVPEMITLSNGTIEVLPCCPQDNSTNMLLVFRQGVIVTHIYIGLCSDLVGVLLNKTFISWVIGNNANTAMYIPLNTEPIRCTDCELRNAIAEIEKRVNEVNTEKLLIQLPYFGSESFINKIALAFPGIVSICGCLKDVYTILPFAKTQYFTENINTARIIITGSDTNEFVSRSLNLDYGTISKKSKIKWSPLPTPKDLKLLSDLVRPKNIYGIQFKNNFAALEQPVQISSFFLRSRILNGKLVRSQYNAGQHCCLENFEKKTQKITDNFNRIFKSVVRKHILNEMPKKQEDLNEELPPTSSDLNNKTDSVADRRLCQNSTKKELESTESEPSVQCKKSNNQLDKNSSENIQTHVKSEIEQEANECYSIANTQKITSDQLPTTPTTTSDQSSTNYTKTTTKTQEPEQEQKPASPKTLVYRAGKKGICFDDSSSSD